MAHSPTEEGKEVKPRKPIRRTSTARAKQLREYTKLKAEFFSRQHHCFVCGYWAGPLNRALHHWAKRKGLLLCWVPGFRLVHPRCHDAIHFNETEARVNNWLAPKECCDDYQRAVAHYEANR